MSEMEDPGVGRRTDGRGRRGVGGAACRLKEQAAESVVVRRVSCGTFVRVG